MLSKRNNFSQKSQRAQKGFRLTAEIGHTEPTQERAESQACLSYPERQGGRRSQITENTEIFIRWCS